MFTFQTIFASSSKTVSDSNSVDSANNPSVVRKEHETTTTEESPLVQARPLQSLLNTPLDNLPAGKDKNMAESENSETEAQESQNSEGHSGKLVIQ